MKKLLSIIMAGVMLITMLILIPSAGAKSQKEYYDKASGTYYTLNSKGNAVVTHTSVYYTDYWKIPSKLNGHKVTKIAFTETYEDIPNKVRIPKTVTSINNKFKKSVFMIMLDRNSKVTKLVVSKGSYAHKYAMTNYIEYYLLEEKRYYSTLLADVYVYDTKGRQLKSSSRNYDLPNYTYTGKEVKPKFTFKQKSTGKVLKKNVDYTVKYYNNIIPGEAVAVVTGKKNYFRLGQKIYYKIVPEKAKKLSFYDYDDRASVYGSYDCTYAEYEIIYSTDKDFKNYKKIIDRYPEIVNSDNIKTYYVKMRAIVNCNGFNRSYVYFDKETMEYDYTLNYTLKGRWSDVFTFTFKK